MADALEEHDENVSLGDGNITSLLLAVDIDSLAREEQNLEEQVIKPSENWLK